VIDSLSATVTVGDPFEQRQHCQPPQPPPDTPLDALASALGLAPGIGVHRDSREKSTAADAS
jgi:hypothetical protein